MISVCYWGQFC